MLLVPAATPWTPRVWATGDAASANPRCQIAGDGLVSAASGVDGIDPAIPNACPLVISQYPDDTLSYTAVADSILPKYVLPADGGPIFREFAVSTPFEGRVITPPVLTENLLDPPTCKSISVLPAPLAVLVMLANRAAPSTTPLVLSVPVMLMPGDVVLEPVIEPPEITSALLLAEGLSVRGGEPEKVQLEEQPPALGNG